MIERASTVVTTRVATAINTNTLTEDFWIVWNCSLDIWPIVLNTARNSTDNVLGAVMEGKL